MPGFRLGHSCGSQEPKTKHSELREPAAASKASPREQLEGLGTWLRSAPALTASRSPSSSPHAAR
eukprot:2253935-Rhodomonas_salina.2